MTLTVPEATAYESEVKNWTNYFTIPDQAPGLSQNFISNPTELKNLTSFFSWAACAMMGVFGMLALALMIDTLRRLSSDDVWNGNQKYVRTGF